MEFVYDKVAELISHFVIRPQVRILGPNGKLTVGIRDVSQLGKSFYQDAQVDPLLISHREGQLQKEVQHRIVEKWIAITDVESWHIDDSGVLPPVLRPHLML